MKNKDVNQLIDGVAALVKGCTQSDIMSVIITLIINLLSSYDWEGRAKIMQYITHNTAAALCKVDAHEQQPPKKH